MNGLAAFPAVFGAGLLASLSPCVYPLIPITIGFLGTQARGRRAGSIVGYAFGQIVAFAALGCVAVAAGETFGFSSELPGVNLAVGAILALAGGLALLGRLPFGLGPALARLGRRARVARARAGAGTDVAPSAPRSGVAAGWAGAAALGAGSALVASPCTSPILAGVLATMAAHASLARGVALMLCYSLGFTSLFLALGLGLAKLPRSGSWMLALQRAGAVILIAAGAYYLRKGAI